MGQGVLRSCFSSRVTSARSFGLPIYPVTKRRTFDGSATNAERATGVLYVSAGSTTASTETMATIARLNGISSTTSRQELIGPTTSGPSPVAGGLEDVPPTKRFSLGTWTPRSLGAG